MHNFDPTNNISWQLGHRGLVAVFIDGIGFNNPAVVRHNRRVVQKGKLANGQSIEQAVPAGKTVKIKLRNSDGGETEVAFRR